MPDKTKKEEEEEQEEVVAHTRICLAGQLETGLDSTETILAHTHTHIHTSVCDTNWSWRRFLQGVVGGEGDVACCVC